MNAEDRVYLEVLKTPPLSVADNWLIFRLEAEAGEVERLREEVAYQTDEADRAKDNALAMQKFQQEKVIVAEDTAAREREWAADLEHIFALQRTRMDIATAMWQGATGKLDVLPDLGDLLDWLQARIKALEGCAQELLLVADLRGDADLPLAEDDSKLWTARMQQAWDDLRALLTPAPNAEFSGEEETHG